MGQCQSAKEARGRGEEGKRRTSYLMSSFVERVLPSCIIAVAGPAPTDLSAVRLQAQHSVVTDPAPVPVRMPIQPLS